MAGRERPGGDGLESRPAQHGRAAARPGRPAGERDPVGALLGTLFEQAVRDPAAAPASTAAAYHLPAAVANAFAVRLTLSQQVAEGGSGRYGFALYTGEPGGEGYRLDAIAGRPEGEVAFALERRTARGTVQTIEAYDGPKRLASLTPHELLWTRDGAGRMAVRLDGELLFEVVDRGVRAGFRGFQVVNNGGDLALTRLRIDTVR